MEPPDRPQGAEHQHAVCGLESIRAITQYISMYLSISFYNRKASNQQYIYNRLSIYLSYLIFLSNHLSNMYLTIYIYLSI